ncbi:ATP-binding protein [Roseinatronobacter sp. NSM]|uniref:ATP-binding protein n=1 Tax=Roseinatronobacter sp. NSM TaxID=3457785 RepID=UPI004034FB0C
MTAFSIRVDRADFGVQARSALSTRILKAIERTELLILDEWGLSVLTSTKRRDLLEILHDRQGRGATIVTSQLPVDQWFDVIGILPSQMPSVAPQCTPPDADRREHAQKLKKFLSSPCHASPKLRHICIITANRRSDGLSRSSSSKANRQ